MLHTEESDSDSNVDFEEGLQMSNASSTTCPTNLYLRREITDLEEFHEFAHPKLVDRAYNKGCGHSLSLLELRELLKCLLLELHSIRNLNEASSELCCERIDEEVLRCVEGIGYLYALLAKKYHGDKKFDLVTNRLSKSLQLYTIVLAASTASRLLSTHFSQYMLKGASCVVMKLLNELGVSYFNRGMAMRGIHFLKRAERFARTAQTQLQSPNDFLKEQAVKNKYYLAQATSTTNDSFTSAQCCTETLSAMVDKFLKLTDAKEGHSRGLESLLKFKTEELVRNCCKLSDFYISQRFLWTAEYLLHAAEYIVSKWRETVMDKYDKSDRDEALPIINEVYAEVCRDLSRLYCHRLVLSRALFFEADVKTPVERSEGLEVHSNDASDSNNWHDEFSYENNLSYPENEADCLPVLTPLLQEPAYSSLFPEALQEVDLSTKKSSFETVTSDENEHPTCDDSSGDSYVNFKSIHSIVQEKLNRMNRVYKAQRKLTDLPEQLQSRRSTLETCETFLGYNFPLCCEIFKMSNHYATLALKFYHINEWATDNTRLLMQQSALLRCLSFFEADANRVSLMLKRRAKLIEPLLDILNPKYYLQYVRNIARECGEIYFELYSLADAEEAHQTDASVRGLKETKTLWRFLMRSEKCHKTYLETFEQTNAIEKEIPTEEVTNYYAARFSVAKIYALLSQHERGTKEFLHRAFQEYTSIKDQLSNHQSLRGKNAYFDQQFGVCDSVIASLQHFLNRID